MIKTSTGSMYAIIKRITAENGGEPVVLLGSNMLLTYENWLLRHSIGVFDLTVESDLDLESVFWN